MDEVDVKSYALQVAASMGLDPSVLQDPSLDSLSSMSHNDINKALATIAMAQSIGKPAPTLKLSEEERKVLTTLTAPGVNQEIREIEANIERRLREIQARFEAIEERLRYNVADKLKLDVLLGKGSTYNLIPGLEEILQDSWYSFNGVHGISTDMYVSFYTKDVYCAYKNPDAGIDITVGLGQYTVKYYPHKGYIKVTPYCGNYDVDGFVHPHVSSDGHVCWGNASTTYSEAMVNLDPAPAFQALRVLLNTYNDESPYENLMSFLRQADPDKFEALPEEYRSVDTYWIRDCKLPNRLIDSLGENEDEDSVLITKVRVYERTKGGVRTSEYAFVRVQIDGGKTAYYELDLTLDDLE